MFTQSHHSCVFGVAARTVDQETPKVSKSAWLLPPNTRVGIKMIKNEETGVLISKSENGFFNWKVAIDLVAPPYLRFAIFLIADRRGLAELQNGSEKKGRIGDLFGPKHFGQKRAEAKSESKRNYGVDPDCLNSCRWLSPAPKNRHKSGAWDLANPTYNFGSNFSIPNGVKAAAR